MSLEKALEANTAAVLKLVESNDELKHQLSHLVARWDNDGMPDRTSQSPQQYADAVARQPATKKPEAAAKPSKATSAPTAAAPASTEAAPPAATSTSLTYDDIKKPFLELAKRDLEAAKAVLTELKLGTLKDAKPEQYAEILEKLSANSEEGMA